jgi:hypothetical protein
MRWKGLSRAGRRTFGVPAVPSMTDGNGAPPDGAQQSSGRVGGTDRPLIDRAAVQYLDCVRAIFRPTRRDMLVPGLERFVGEEDLFRHVGMASDGIQPMMQCPVHWPGSVKWVPIGDLEILEILEDQDVRAG